MKCEDCGSWYGEEEHEEGNNFTYFPKYPKKPICHDCIRKRLLK